jgi:hypothetical protein
MKIFLRHDGEGMFSAATPYDRETAVKFCPIGRGMWHEVETFRSVKQNKWFHGLITVAFNNQRGERWASKDILRAYTLCAVGHKTTTEFTFPDTFDPHSREGWIIRATLENFAAELVKQMLARDEHAFIRTTPTGIAVDKPRSWAFHKLKPEDANELADKIATFIVSDDGPCPGADIKQLFEAADREHDA